MTAALATRAPSLFDGLGGEPTLERSGLRRMGGAHRPRDRHLPGVRRRDAPAVRGALTAGRRPLQRLRVDAELSARARWTRRVRAAAPAASGPGARIAPSPRGGRPGSRASPGGFGPVAGIARSGTRHPGRSRALVGFRQLVRAKREPISEPAAPSRLRDRVGSAPDPQSQPSSPARLLHRCRRPPLSLITAD